jgi:uncharacterized membrane protein
MGRRRVGGVLGFIGVFLLVFLGVWLLLGCFMGFGVGFLGF